MLRRCRWPQDDPLPSWNDGAAKTAILDFVTQTTTEGGANFVAPADRIATFDQDGTLWVEQPLYGQGLFALDRLATMAPDHPEWKDTEPFKAVLTGDHEAMAKFTEKDWMEIVAVTHAGMSTAVSDAVVTISAPVLDGDTLTFDAVVLEGGLTGTTGPAALFIDRGGFHGGGMAGGRHGGGFACGGGDHFSNPAHVQNPHSAWYRSDSGNRSVDYDPHNNFYGGDGGGYYGHPWAAGAAGLAAGAAIGAGIADNNNYPYPYPYCGYPPYPPCN